MAERTDSGRLLQREGAHKLKALVPVLVLILGMNRVIALFDLGERDGREVAIKKRKVNRLFLMKTPGGQQADLEMDSISIDKCVWLSVEYLTSFWGLLTIGLSTFSLPKPTTGDFLLKSSKVTK